MVSSTYQKLSICTVSQGLATVNSAPKEWAFSRFFHTLCSLLMPAFFSPIGIFSMGKFLPNLATLCSLLIVAGNAHSLGRVYCKWAKLKEKKKVDRFSGCLFFSLK